MRRFDMRMFVLILAVEGRVPGLGPSSAFQKLGASAPSHHLGGKERHVHYSATQTTEYLGRYLLVPRHLDILARVVCRNRGKFAVQLTNVPLLGGRPQRSNVVAIPREASNSSCAYALCHVFNILKASQCSQPSERLVSIHPTPFNAPNLLISSAYFAARAQHCPTGIFSPLVPCICAVLAIVASSPSAECRSAVSPSPFGGNAVHCAG